MSNRLDVVISIRADEQASAVVGRLVAAGLEDADLQAALGTVTGRVSPTRLDGLRAVEGVEAVEVSRDVHV